MSDDYNIALETSKEYHAIFQKINMIIETSDDYDDDLIDHMERYAIDLDDNLTDKQKEIYYKMIGEN